jgi:hypothetical protein
MCNKTSILLVFLFGTIDKRTTSGTILGYTDTIDCLVCTKETAQVGSVAGGE